MHRYWSITAFTAVLMLVACANERLAVGVANEEFELGESTSALYGKIDDGFPVSSATADEELCHPFAMTYMERAQVVATAVVSTNVFDSCLQDRFPEIVMTAPDEPFFSFSKTHQASSVLAALRGDNHTEINCDPDAPTDHAPNLGYGHETTTAWTQSNWWTRQAWERYAPYSNGEPWAARVRTIVHEMLHTHSYSHPEGDCYDGPTTGCADAACSWTVLCGGSGAVPATPAFNGGARDARNRISVLNGLPEDEYSRRKAQLPTPLQTAERCAHDLVTQSAARCGELFSCASPDSVRLSAAYDPATNQYRGACTCVPRQRHAVAFAAKDTGRYLTSAGTAGSLLTADAVAQGSWQTFHLHDLNGGRLEHDDRITILTNGDRFVVAGPALASVRGDATTDDSSEATWRIRRVAGPGIVADGDEIALFNVLRARYVTAQNGGGSSVFCDQVDILPWEKFIYLEPRRAHLVQLQTHDARFVTYDPAVSSELTTEPLAAEFLWTPKRANPALRRQSFWIVDRNGGQLMPGDQVSIEWSAQPKYWTSCSSGTGNLRGNADYGGDSTNTSCQRFIVRRASGSGPINNRDQIALLSVAQRRFLTAIAAPGPFRIHNDRNEELGAGPWGQFTIRFSQDDRYGTAPAAPRPSACSESVQGQVAWNYTGATTWNDSNVARLCAGAEDSTHPAACFAEIMHGGISWSGGGGTLWRWQDAVDLCEGTRDWGGTVRCFIAAIESGSNLASATDACETM